MPDTMSCTSSGLRLYAAAMIALPSVAFWPYQSRAWNQPEITAFTAACLDLRAAPRTTRVSTMRPGKDAVVISVLPPDIDAALEIPGSQVTATSTVPATKH